MTYQYVGSELELFSAAVNWKSYLAETVRGYLGPRVLEVGAGIGSNIAPLFKPPVVNWVALEPDMQLATQIQQQVDAGRLPKETRAVVGTSSGIAELGRFDTILYIDVLEHIENDAEELIKAACQLNPGGYLVVIVPAHPALYSRFDEAIGHYRRYTSSSLRRLAPPTCDLVVLQSLDCVGLLASMANKILLRQGMPSAQQIALWDRLMVPLSRRIDPLIGYMIGKSLMAVWRRTC